MKRNFAAVPAVMQDESMAIIHFGSVTFDTRELALYRDGAQLPLQDQPARVLAYLIEHRDRTVLRDELIEHVWRDGRHVQFDQGLNYCIRQIRLALADSAATPRYLATIDRKGYRWIASAHAPSDRLYRMANHPVPAWLAGAAATALVTLTMMIGANAPVTREAVRADGNGERSVLTALHRFSHQVIDPLVVRLLDRDELGFVHDWR